MGSFSETEVSIKFRFRNRGQLQVLFNNLRVPDFFRFIDDKGKNHGRVSGEEAFLICLARLSSTKTLHDLVADFGRDYSWITLSSDRRNESIVGDSMIIELIGYRNCPVSQKSYVVNCGDMESSLTLGRSLYFLLSTARTSSLIELELNRNEMEWELCELILR